MGSIPIARSVTVSRSLWHASDDPSIEIFHPRHAPTSNINGEYVWAVDDEHVPAYWFPRDCPRATFWIGPSTSADDIAWLNGANRVHAVEVDVVGTAGIELRLVHDLWPLWDRVTSSTLQFSGIRLSNARRA